MEEAGESEEEESENDEEENGEEREEAGEEQGEEQDGTKKRKKLDVAEYRTEFNGPERATAYAASWNRTMTRFPRVVWKPSETTFRGEIKFMGHRFGMGSYPNEEDGGRAMDALARLLRNKYPELDIFPEEAMNYPGQRAQATDIRRINKTLIKINRLVEKIVIHIFRPRPRIRTGGGDKINRALAKLKPHPEGPKHHFEPSLKARVAVIEARSSQLFATAVLRMEEVRLWSCQREFQRDDRLITLYAQYSSSC